ncbi:hypothetical protein ACLB2K_068506 [Fragaria x ananassa]
MCKELLEVSLLMLPVQFALRLMNPFSIYSEIVPEWKKGQNRAKADTMYSYSMLSWKMPLLNFFKLNIDGTRATASGKIGAGGVIRNHAGTWIIGFQINLGVGEILTAEAWGLFYGLKLAVKLQISNLEVESDSAILVNFDTKF